VIFEGFLFEDDSFEDFFEVDDLELVDFGEFFGECFFARFSGSSDADVGFVW
jgi:hypothetical protein